MSWSDDKELSLGADIINWNWLKKKKDENTPINILNYLKRLDYFPNAYIVYRILLTIHVTVVSVERKFSKLKLIKPYLRFTMS